MSKSSSRGPIRMTSRGPIAAQRQYIRTFHADQVADPWHWLDTPQSEEVAALVRAENAWADQVLAPTQPLRARIRDELKSLTQETDVTAPVKEGEYWYYSRTREGIDYPAHYRVKGERPALDPYRVSEAEQLIVDEARRAQGKDFYASTNHTVAHDGRWYMWAEDTTGGELFDLIILDLQTGKIIDESVKSIGYGIATTDAWVYYVRMTEAWRPYQIWVHRIGTDQAEDRLVLEEPDEKFGLWIRRSRDSRWIVIEAESTLSTKSWLIPTGAPSAPLPFVNAQEDMRFRVEPAGDHFAITHNRHRKDESLALAPMIDRSRFVPLGQEIDVEELCGLDQWVEVWTPTDGERLLAVTAFADFTAAVMRSSGQSAIRILHRADNPGDLSRIYDEMSWVEWDEPVRVIEMGSNREWHTDRLRFTVESFALPQIDADWIVATGGTEIVKRQVVPGFEPDKYETRREWVTAEDGTQIPVALVHRKGIEPDGSNPALEWGYGSYEVSLEPWFMTSTISLLDRGLVVALASIRGGGELGRDWYEQGKLEKKPNTFTDFVAVGRWLVDTGWAAPDRLAALGGSAGGLLVGAAANLAPDLYRFISAQVPFVDALNTILDPSKPLTIGEWDEWGNPIESEEIYRVMRGYSPYENIQPAPYPTIFAETSLNDIRVSFVEPLKWVQRLRADSVVGVDNPVVIAIEEVAGHAGVSGRSKMWDEIARRWAFLLHTIDAVNRMD
ncbi:MAG: prolyl oligopeptidase family serine peptidase [Actinomycetaceae bacterium]|nr:prolyl oligopeptidase family serine peptidase [Actinomycetaceae bacterium]